MTSGIDLLQASLEVGHLFDIMINSPHLAFAVPGQQILGHEQADAI